MLSKEHRIPTELPNGPLWREGPQSSPSPGSPSQKRACYATGGKRWHCYCPWLNDSLLPCAMSSNATRKIVLILRASSNLTSARLSLQPEPPAGMTKALGHRLFLSFVVLMPPKPLQNCVSGVPCTLGKNFIMLDLDLCVHFFTFLHPERWKRNCLLALTL